LAQQAESSFDIEYAVLSGKMTLFERDDDRGIKFVIEATAVHPEIQVGVVGRFATSQ
jgi:hypothetical protein